MCVYVCVVPSFFYFILYDSNLYYTIRMTMKIEILATVLLSIAVINFLCREILLRFLLIIFLMKYTCESLTGISCYKSVGDNSARDYEYKVGSAIALAS